MYPVLARVEVDTKERYKFFGGKRQRSCGVGSGPRRGRSLFRQCTPHATRGDIDHKRQLVQSGENGAAEAAASLARRGLHPTISCPAVLEDGKDIILSHPGRMFGGLYAFDTMHHLYINSAAYLLEGVVDLLTPSKRRALDKCVKKFSSFRDPYTGVPARRVSTVTKLSYLTAELRVATVFTLAHAVGHMALLFPEGVRVHVLTALSAFQIICFVSRGKRPFTAAEHNFVFGNIGKSFWRSLAMIVSWKERCRAQLVRRMNLNRSPSKHKRPKIFRPKPADSDESSDTIDTDDDDTDVPSHFTKSDKMVPHCLVHLPDQVKMGGTHQFHNTSAPESHHKPCIQEAGTRVRKYSGANVTERHMLTYTLQMHLFDEISVLIDKGS